MTILSKQTPTHYKTVRLGVQKTDAGDVVATLDIRILNSAGRQVGTATQSATLTPAEKAQLLAFVNGVEAEFEAGDGAGLAEWTGALPG